LSPFALATPVRGGELSVKGAGTVRYFWTCDWTPESALSELGAAAGLELPELCGAAVELAGAVVELDELQAALSRVMAAHPAMPAARLASLGLRGDRNNFVLLD
jgi:hypothetical protein